MLHVVMRPLPGPEGDIPSGTLVDPTKWRNTESLVNFNYMRPLTDADMKGFEGLEEVQVNEHGISDINIFANKTPAKKLAIPRKKKRAK